MEKRNSNPSEEGNGDRRWEAISHARQDVASALDQMSAELPGAGRRQLRSLSRWFRGSASMESAVNRPDVLAICLPLMGESPEGEFSKSDIAKAARIGFCSIGRYVSVTRRLLKLLCYPFLILLAIAILGFGFCFWVAPTFEELYNGFGIGLPSTTDGVLWVAGLVRRWWWVIMSFFGGQLAGVALLIWIVYRTGRDLRPANLSWLDLQLMSRRNALAMWAWHLSLLLEAGFGQREAGKIAARATGKSWFRSARAMEDGACFLFRSKYELLNNALRMPPCDGKIGLLRHVATYYWDRSRSVGDWWIHWLVGLMLSGVGILVFLCVLSLFLPLLSIVSGLSGGGW